MQKVVGQCGTLWDRVVGQLEHQYLQGACSIMKNCPTVPLKKATLQFFQNGRFTTFYSKKM